MSPDTGCGRRPVVALRLTRVHMHQRRNQADGKWGAEFDFTEAVPWRWRPVLPLTCKPVPLCNTNCCFTLQLSQQSVTRYLNAKR